MAKCPTYSSDCSPEMNRSGWLTETFMLNSRRRGTSEWRVWGGETASHLGQEAQSSVGEEVVWSRPSITVIGCVNRQETGMMSSYHSSYSLVSRSIGSNCCLRTVGSRNHCSSSNLPPGTFYLLASLILTTAAAWKFSLREGNTAWC